MVEKLLVVVLFYKTFVICIKCMAGASQLDVTTLFQERQLLRLKLCRYCKYSFQEKEKNNVLHKIDFPGEILLLSHLLSRIIHFEVKLFNSI